MEGKQITAADLLLAVKVCAEEPIDRVTWRDQWEALKMKHRPGYLNQQLERFVAFTLLTQWPKFWEKQGKTSGSVNSIPWGASNRVQPNETRLPRGAGVDDA